MLRKVRPELLDQLPAGDPEAIRSRGDLQTLNVLMGNARILARALIDRTRGRPPATLVELGSGDGTFLLRVARRIGPRWKGIRAVLVDQQSLVSAETRAGFDSISWRIEPVQADVFEWLRKREAHGADVTVANLFLHHFAGQDLSTLLRDVAHQTRLFAACEPRRSRRALLWASMVGLIGCNRVTRHDAAVSVRAGFDGRELSAAWPAGTEWTLTEGRANRFTHLFVAQHARHPR